MNDNIQIHDRVIVSNNEYSNLTNYYVIEEQKNSFKCKFENGIISGILDVSKNIISKHPIQKSQFTFEIQINGNRIPKANDFSGYIRKYNNPILLNRMAIVCFKEILKNILDHRNIDIINQIFSDCISSVNTIKDLDEWIKGTSSNFPENYYCRCMIEFSGENKPIAIFTSEHPDNYNSTTLFLLCFTIIMLELKILTKDDLKALL